MRHNCFVYRCLFGLVVGVAPLGGVNAQPADAGPPVEITGELEVLYADDFDNKRAELLHFIRDRQTGKRLQLRFDGPPPGHLRSGSVVRARGRPLDDELLLAADGDGTQSVTVVQSAESAISGEQRTVVLVANFQDTAVSCSVDQIRDVMFTDPTNNSIDDLYRETSLGSVWFSGSVHGPYSINGRSTDACDVNAWAAAADAAAEAMGIDVGSYARKVYVLPSQNSCGWSGLGSVGGNPSYAWIFRCDLPAVFGHELGHNLSMNHASTLNSEYGDTSDIMGSEMSGLRQINGPHQEQMGWRSSFQFVDITEAGTYDIAPIELAASQTLAPQVLKISKPDSGEHYYLSYRQPIGFDANLSSNLTSRVQVHRYQGNGGRTWALRGLLDGETFVDDVNGLSVTHIQHNPDYATVEVAMNVSCQSSAPQISLSPTDQQAVGGTALDYTVTLDNEDSAACSQSTYDLIYALPDGWFGNLSPASTSLLPGQRGQATLSVTSPSGSAEGNYTVAVDVADATDPGHTGSATARYEVVATCVTAPPALSVSPVNQSTQPGTQLSYTVSVTNQDQSGCSATNFDLGEQVPTGWSASLSPATLKLGPSETGQASLFVNSPISAAEGAYVVGVMVTDATAPVHTVSGDAVYTVLTGTDSQPPSPPTALSASVKSKQVILSWNASTDDVGVAGYQIWRNGEILANTADTSIVDRAIDSGSTYNYFVVARDPAGNVSAQSNSVTATIRGGGGNTGGDGGNKGGGKTKKP